VPPATQVPVGFVCAAPFESVSVTLTEPVGRLAAGWRPFPSPMSSFTVTVNV